MLLSREKTCFNSLNKGFIFFPPKILFVGCFPLNFSITFFSPLRNNSTAQSTKHSLRRSPTYLCLSRRDKVSFTTKFTLFPQFQKTSYFMQREKKIQVEDQCFHIEKFLSMENKRLKS